MISETQILVELQKLYKEVVDLSIEFLEFRIYKVTIALLSLQTKEIVIQLKYDCNLSLSENIKEFEKLIDEAIIKILKKGEN